MSLAIFALMISVFCMVNRSMPSFSVRTAISCIIIARLAATALLYETVLQLIWDRIYVYLARLVATLMFGSFPSSLLLNATYSIIVSGVWASFARRDRLVDSLVGPDSVQWFIVQEAASLVSLCCLRLMFENCTRSEAKATCTIEEKAAREFQAATQMLLRTMYDLVIQLDQDFKLVENAEALGGMLLHGCNRSLKGASLLDYMYGEEDKELFHAHVNQMPTDELQSMAIPLRLRMRDSSGRPLDVELLHSTFKDIDAQTCHIIGIQEIEHSKTAFKELAGLDRRSPVHRQCRQQHLERGTPPNGVREELTGTLSNVAPAPVFSRRAMPQFEETESMMPVFSLLSLLLKWNLQVPSTFCCNYHFYVYHAQGLLRHMQKKKCEGNLFNALHAGELESLGSTGQCTRCGMLGAEIEAADPCCLWCENWEEVPETGQNDQNNIDNNNYNNNNNNDYNSRREQTCVKL
ncbi:unnamed protein product [Polarella glacialis]|uniref:Uncharacterized protein n=3 Tax=Polarella glacialis TaxID=89957 RepID=A0A813IEX6_POLGL|nr:unnamed protein product [Polarella glacialis]